MPDPGISVPRLRDAVQSRVDATSRRATAREIGFTPRGLEIFLSGAKPQSKTLAKLLAWYEQYVAEADGPPISEADAIRVLLRPLPPEARLQAQERITEFLVQRGFSCRYSQPNLPTHLQEQGNVILSAAASPIQTRTNTRRRPKDLGSARGRERPKRALTLPHYERELRQALRP